MTYCPNSSLEILFRSYMNQVLTSSNFVRNELVGINAGEMEKWNDILFYNCLLFIELFYMPGLLCHFSCHQLSSILNIIH